MSEGSGSNSVHLMGCWLWPLQQQAAAGARVKLYAVCGDLHVHAHVCAHRQVDVKGVREGRVQASEVHGCACQRRQYLGGN
jgi:hypothetical protein